MEVSPCEKELGANSDDDTDDELADITLYYKAFNLHRPEPKESNAESAARHRAIAIDYRRLKQQRR